MLLSINRTSLIVFFSNKISLDGCFSIKTSTLFCILSKQRLAYQNINCYVFFCHYIKFMSISSKISLCFAVLYQNNVCTFYQNFLFSRYKLFCVSLSKYRLSFRFLSKLGADANLKQMLSRFSAFADAFADAWAT